MDVTGSCVVRAVNVYYYNACCAKGVELQSSIRQLHGVGVAATPPKQVSLYAPRFQYRQRPATRLCNTFKGATSQCQARWKSARVRIYHEERQLLVDAVKSKTNHGQATNVLWGFELAVTELSYLGLSLQQIPGLRSAEATYHS